MALVKSGAGAPRSQRRLGVRLSYSVRIKLFGRDTEAFSEDDYYESFFNVDFPGGFVYWNEKDPEYRAPLVAALGVV
jgi:hypothetical protein